MKAVPDRLEEQLLGSPVQSVFLRHVILLQVLQVLLHLGGHSRARQQMVGNVRVVATEDFRRAVEEAARVLRSGTVAAGQPGEAKVERRAGAVAVVVEVAALNLLHRQERVRSDERLLVGRHERNRGVDRLVLSWGSSRIVLGSGDGRLLLVLLIQDDQPPPYLLKAGGVRVACAVVAFIQPQQLGYSAGCCRDGCF